MFHAFHSIIFIT